jgi:recombination protein RecA
LNALDKAMGEINKKYGKQMVQMGTSRIYVDKIPFSSPKLNWMTYGGVPIGKATELIGQESGGKTTNALDIVANAQKKAERDYRAILADTDKKIEALEDSGTKTALKEADKLRAARAKIVEDGPRRVVYVDLENTLDEDWAELLGVDLEALYLARFDDETAEQVLQAILDLIATGQVIALVVDSIPMLVPQQIATEDLSKKSYGGIAGAVTEFCRRVSSLISTNKTALIIINQVREDFDNPYNQYKTPGGRALKHLYALRLFFRKGTYFDADYKELKNKNAVEPAGHIIDVEIVKTKVCKPDRRLGQETLTYDKGIDITADTLDMAIRYKLIELSGAWHYIMDSAGTGEVRKDEMDEDMKFQGRPRTLEFFLNEGAEVFEEIYEEVHSLVTALPE